MSTKAKLDAAGVFEVLQTNRVPHVAADPVEFVAEDRFDLLALGVGLDPGKHLVEGNPVRPPFRGLGHDKLTSDMPAIRLYSLPGQAKLGIDRIPLSLLAG